MVRSGIGDAPKRREDLRFLTGHGRYLDALAFDGLTHAVVLRSPNAHAYSRVSIRGRQRRCPAVLALLTAADALADGLKRPLPDVEAATQTGEPFTFVPDRALGAAARPYSGALQVFAR
jgi:aerobic carbon-monoxide dehydrogenase large subunit